MVTLFELSHHFLRILLVKLILLVILEDPALIKEPVGDDRGVEGWDELRIRYPKNTLPAAWFPNRHFRYANLTIFRDLIPD